MINENSFRLLILNKPSIYLNNFLRTCVTNAFPHSTAYTLHVLEFPIHCTLVETILCSFITNVDTWK